MTIYIPGVATLQSHFGPADSAFWVRCFYGAMIVLTPAVIWILFDSGMKVDGVESKDRWPVRQMVAGAVSFAIWGASVPGVFPGAQWILGWLAVAVATLLPSLDKKFARRPS